MLQIPSINFVYIFDVVIEFFSSADYSYFYSALSFLRSISIFLSLLFLTGIIFTLFKAWEFNKELAEKDKVKTEKTRETQSISNKKWLRVTEHISSNNPSDWRLAILEADIILEEMLEKMSYHGQTIGEKLKAVEKSDFTTIDSAWEAHKIRNTIAHEGSDFLITEREAKRVIKLYEAVFKEFKFI